MRAERFLVCAFNRFVSGVTQELNKCRKHHSRFEDNPAFVTVMHDGWDSNRDKMLGVSLAWIDPMKWKLSKVAVGLTKCGDGRAIGQAAATLEVVARYGVAETDLLASVNDTTNSALATARILVGEEGGECQMHKNNLAIEHAIGKRQRTARGVVVDDFPPGEMVLKSGRALVGHIMNRKKKVNWEYYIARNPNATVFRIPIDNDTRIAGTHRLLQSLLRSVFMIERYLPDESRSSRKSFEGVTANWDLVAQFEAVLRYPCTFAMEVQKDQSVSIGSSWLNVLLLKQSAKATSYKVINLDAEKWDGSKSFEQLPKTRVPVEKMSQEARELIQRLEANYDTYFDAPKDHTLISLVLDPIVWTLGRPFIQAYDSGRIEEALALVKEEYERLAPAKDAVVAEQEGGPEDSNQDEDSRDSTLFGMLMDIQQEADSGTDAVAQMSEFDRWMVLSSMVDWRTEAVRQGAKLPKISEAKLKSKLKNPSFVLEHVNPLLWWKENASKFPVLSSMALRFLAKPDSNGFQERVFSKAKLVDSPLRQRLSTWKYEILVLQALNQAWIEEEGFSLYNMCSTREFKSTTGERFGEEVSRLISTFESSTDRNHEDTLDYAQAFDDVKSLLPR